MAVQRKVSENIVEKGENAGDKHLRFFLQCFQFGEGESFIIW